MPFTLQDLTNAGLPASSTDGNNSSAQTVFSRTLTPAEWLTYLSIADPDKYKLLTAKTDMTNVPNWATYTQTQYQSWWDSKLADSIVDGFAIPANVKVMLKDQNLAILRIGQLIIAIRDIIKFLSKYITS